MRALCYFLIGISFTIAQIEWIDIPAGDFTYGYNDEISTIDYDYQIMKYEVTNEQYVTYLEDALTIEAIEVSTTAVMGYYPGDDEYGAGTRRFLCLDNSCLGSYSVAGRISWDGEQFLIESGYENHPVINVSWYGAWGMAQHYGHRLPSDPEWEKAARGDTGWRYPWGEDITSANANFYNSGDPHDNNTTPIRNL